MVAGAGGPYVSLQALLEEEVTPSELGSKAAGCLCKMPAGVYSLRLCLTCGESCIHMRELAGWRADI